MSDAASASASANGAAAGSPIEVTSSEHFTSLMEADLTRVSVLNFWAPWAEPCKLMNDVVSALASKHKSVLFLNVEAEAHTEVADSFDVESVPTFVLLRGHTLLGKISGANPAALSSAIETHVGGSAAGAATSRAGGSGARAGGPLSSTDANPRAAPSGGAQGGDGDDEEDEEEEDEEPETPEQIEERCKKLMNQAPVMLFMKGDPDTPRCGFSQKTVNLLRQQGVEFGHYDILKDENVRQGLKKLNDWPTFPQIIIKGELIGGLDILKEHIDNGEFKEMIKAA
ncbi:glutaredoxin [Tilletia horrida]|uniref:Glutaredoxin n=1 Tax=Tilletia horrida TaxID=155126 RepID=A0AAN6G7U6_9BASI|nr:glutaredoxin [Tilletia horrida]KAK0525511.1 glutaredoxin [Tilletia horrida]KAK0531186.1 glutaredoxin [Tilletia horrida]KAK0542151.1 glutaredoxin [Tilletia horrida]